MKQDLQEAKQVMEDEGGATQAGMKQQAGIKQQLGKQSQTFENVGGTWPNTMPTNNDATGRTGPIDAVKREESGETGENSGADPKAPCSTSGK